VNTFDQLDALIAVNRKVADPLAVESETTRICNLPIIWSHNEARAVVERLVNRPGGTWRLRDLQAEALYVIYKLQGGLIPLDVGEGKTLIAALAPRLLKSKCTVILTTKALTDEFWGEYEKYSQHFLVADRATIHTVPYSLLSSRKNARILEELEPDLIIADEAHSLINRDSARTNRLRFYMESPAHCTTRFVAMTGTMFKESVRDIQHLSMYALRHKGPIPLDNEQAAAWAACLDYDSNNAFSWMPQDSAPSDDQLGLMYQLQQAMGLNRDPSKAACRAAFYKRFATCEGVVTTENPTALPQLYINRIEEDALPVPVEVRNALAYIRETGETLDGEEVILDEERMWAVEKQISCGYFYKWDWEAVGGYDEDWLLRRRTWHKELRDELARNGAQGYDSQFIITMEIIRQIADNPNLVRSSKLHWAWDYWSAVKDKPVPPRRAVWLSDFFLVDLLDRACTVGEPVLVWRSSDAVEDGLISLITARGLQEGWRFFGAGSTIPYTGRGTYNALISTNVHRAGVNLQDWHRSIVAEPPASHIIWQQMLGRLHRTGQIREPVFDVYTHTAPFFRSLDTALSKAVFREEIEGSPQKLLNAVWDRGE